MTLALFSQELRAKFNDWYEDFNPEQKGAVNHIALGRQKGFCSLPIVNGPPGTGKTMVASLGAIAYLLQREKSRRKHQVAMLTFSNSAADQTLSSLEKLGAEPDTVVRIASLGYNPPSELEQFFLRYEDPRQLPEKEKRRLREARIFITTADSAQKAFKEARKPYAIFDEISQISRSKFYATLADNDGISLVGDPEQLPVVTHQLELEENIASFLLARSDDGRAHQLVYQYRMHEGICGLVNELRSQFGGHPLETHKSIRGLTLKDSCLFQSMGIKRDSPLWPIVDPGVTCLLIDTSRLPGEEWGIDSKRYDEEARLATDVAKLLKRAYIGLEPVLISPYDAQREGLKELSRGEFDCLSVHQAQGREYDCVIFSMTRKNRWCDIGFLAQKLALTYVGCSRAKRKLVILMSRETFVRRPFPQMVDYVVEGRKQNCGTALVMADTSFQEKLHQETVNRRY